MMGLQFQLDDFEQVAQAANLEDGTVLLGEDTADQVATRNRPTFVKFFRPVLHVSFAIDAALFGANPRVFHGMNLGLHWLAVVLLFCVLPKLGLEKRESSIAAFLFAVHPGKWGAISWIAARGDLLMVLFFLLSIWAMHRYRSQGGRIAAPLPMVFLILALLSKEGAIVCPALLVLCDWAVLRHLGNGTTFRRAALGALPYLALIPGYMLFRHWLFGPWANYYAGEMRTFSTDVILSVFTDFIPITQKLIVGFFYYGTDDVDAWFLPGRERVVGAVFFLAVSVGALWIMRHPFRRIRWSLFGILILFAASVPTLRFFEAASGFDATRLFYLPSCVLCVLLAAPLSGVFARLSPLRLGARIWLCILLATWSIAGVNQYRAQVAAADVITRVRSDLLAFRSADSNDKLAYLVLDVPPGLNRVPLYGTFMTYAFAAPFERDPFLTRSIHNMDFFLGQRHLYLEGYPARLLRWDAGEQRLIAEGGVMPAPSGHRPTVTFNGVPRKAYIEGGVRPRDCPLIELTYESAPQSPFRLDIAFFTEDSEDEAALTVPLYWDPSRGTAKRTFISLDHIKEWVRLGVIRHLSVTLREGTMPQLTSIRTDTSLPTLELISPVDRERRAVNDSEPIFRFRSVKELTHYRLFVHHAGFPITWTLPAEHLLQLDGGDLGFKFSMAGALRTPPDLEDPARLEQPRYWNDMTAGAFRTNVLDAKGVQGFDIDWWIEGYVAQPFLGPWRFHHAQARSPHSTLRVVRPE